MECHTCAIFQQFDQVAIAYGHDAYNSLTPWVRGLFGVLVGVWFAYTMAVRGVLKGDLKWGEIAPKIGIIIFVGALLKFSDFYWDWIFHPLREVMSGVTQMMVSQPSTGVEDASYSGMLGAVEEEVWGVIKLSLLLIDEGSFRHMDLYIAALVLAAPFLFVWGIFFAYVLQGAFMLLAMTAIAPLLVAAAAFKETRSLTFMGARVAFNAVLTVVFAGVAMGFTIYVVRYYTAYGIPMNENGDFINIGQFVWDLPYFSIVLIGFVSILFHLRASTLASQLSGASDGPGAAAVVVGAGMAAGAAVKGATMRAGGALGRASGGLGKSYLASRTQETMAAGDTLKGQIVRRFTR